MITKEGLPPSYLDEQNLTPSERLSHPLGNFEVLTPSDYLEELTVGINQAQRRVLLQAMIYEWGQTTQQVNDALKSAKERGVEVEIHYDDFTNLTASEDLQKKNEAMFAELEKAGIKVVLTNLAKNLFDRIVPYRGRNHRKIIVVDDVAYLGGLNFAEIEYSRPDFMVRITDPVIVEKLANHSQQINENRPKEDNEDRCNEETVLLVDSGQPGKSIIYDRAVALIGQANEVKLTTQLVPTGRLLEALLKASRQQANVSLIVSNPDAIRPGLGKFINELQYVWHDLVGKLPPGLNFDPCWVHAKLLIIKGKREGCQWAAAIIGSHNFDERGVRAGTEEIALLSTNQTLVKNLERFYDLLHKKISPPPAPTINWTDQLTY